MDYQRIDLSDDDNSYLQMQQKNRPKRNVLEAQIQEGDTLQAIAIRYNCSVSSFIFIF